PPRRPASGAGAEAPGTPQRAGCAAGQRAGREPAAGPRGPGGAAMTRATLLGAAVALALAAAAAAVEAAPLCVNPTGSAPCFATIQAALNSPHPPHPPPILPRPY